MFGNLVILCYVNCLGTTFLIALPAPPFACQVNPFWMSYYVSFDPVNIDVPKDSDFNIYRTGKSQYPPLGIW